MRNLFPFLKKYSFLLGIILFIVILSTTNLEKIFQNIKNVNFLYLFLAILLIFPILLSKSFCWNYLKRKQEIKYNLKDSFLMYCSGLYVGFVTPGRIGELIKALYLKQDGYSFGKSLVSIILDRISDIIFLLIFVIFTSLFCLNLINKQIWISLIIVLSLIFLFFLFLKSGSVKIILKKLFYILVPQKYQKSWKVNFQDFVNDLKIYKLKNYLIIALITIISWCFYYLQMYFLAKSININLPFFYLATVVTIAGLITLIPISVSGLGTRDAALILLLSPFLILKEQAIAFSVLILFMSLLSASVGLICWLIKPIKFQ